MRRLAGGFICAAVCAAAHAGIIFSNVTITGSLSTGATFTANSPSIDFYFPDAIVGDPVDPRREGNIQITYEATSDDGIDQDQMIFSVLGALAGSGTIFINEVVEDLINPGVIATYNAFLDDNSQLPHTATIDFSRTSSHIKVKKTFFLNAIPDTEGFDLAAVGLVEQTLRQIPEPATLLLLALGGLLQARRR